MGKSVYEIVSERVIASIEEAIQTNAPLVWQKPWVFANPPRNFISQRAYSGINTLLLTGGEYITWSQICDLKKQNPDVALKKGSRREMVVYFNVLEPKKDEPSGDEAAKPERKPHGYLRYYYVYNVNDVNGITPTPPVEKYHHDPIEKAQSVFDAYIKREEICLEQAERDGASYSPLLDKIKLPLMEQFKDIGEYYSTAFHEAVHSTGATKRLNRNLAAPTSQTEYSKEELVAEMGATMLMGRCGIMTARTEKNSVAYLRSWLEALKNNPTMLVSASAKAEAAAKFILAEI